MPENGFLLIKAWSHSLWVDVHQLLEQLLAAELSNRIPVVYWGTNCLYNGAIHNNAFDLYFEPVSQYSIEHLMRPEYTFYPPVWEYDNLMANDPGRITNVYRNAGDMLENNADVVVCDYYSHINQLMPMITEKHPAYGMSAVQIYRYLIKKYLRLKPDIQTEIQRFYQNNLASGPNLAIHVRGNFEPDEDFLTRELNRIYHSEIVKIKRSDEFYTNDTALLHQIPVVKRTKKHHQPNSDYYKEIVNFLSKYNIQKIFLITDSNEVARDYKEKYGDKVVVTDCSRKNGDQDERFYYLDSHMTKRRKGIEVLKDTYLASGCQFFIGNGYSNLSHAVHRLKDWPETNIRLLYWIMDKRLIPEKKNLTVYPQNEFIDYLQRTSLFASNLINVKSRM